MHRDKAGKSVPHTHSAGPNLRTKQPHKLLRGINSSFGMAAGSEVFESFNIRFSQRANTSGESCIHMPIGNCTGETGTLRLEERLLK
jgi:hypothetical protein